MIRISDIENLVISQPNPLDIGHDEAPIDDILEESNLDSFPSANNEGWQLPF
jgi:hypothetical protein